MGNVEWVGAHIDDEMISAGVLNVFYAAHGHTVNLNYMNRGGNGGPSGQLDGTEHCVRHNLTHNPVRESYLQQVPFQPVDIGLLRIAEGRSIAGMLDSMPPLVDKGNGAGFYQPGDVTYSDHDLPDGFGGLAGQPPTEAGIDAVYDVICERALARPGSIFLSHAEDDVHPDHAACGRALRRAVVNGKVGPAARWVVSPNFWFTTTAFPVNRALIYAHGPGWFDPGMYYPLARESIREFARMTVGIYDSWNPAGGSYAIGAHQVWGQILKVYGPGKTPAVLWYD